MPKEVKVRLKVSNGRIQLVYTHDRRRNYLSLGLSDNPVNRRLAELKAAEIEQDILFDRYKGIDFYRGIEPTQSPVIKSNEPDYRALWDEWIEYRYTIVNPTTKGDYQYICAIVERCPYGLDDAVAVKNWLMSSYSYEVSRRVIEKLIACFQWSINQNKIDFNPYKQHKLVNKSAKHRREINPFTVEERDKIIDYCAKSEWYSHYSALIEFIFFTGCRPSEAIALRWSDVNKDRTQITFSQAATKGENSRMTIKQGLKTQQSRRINLNDRVVTIINKAELRRINNGTFVFPSKRDDIINWPNFRQRCWRDLLDGCAIAYRSPYQMRHTFITLALRSGMPVADVASLVGNSPAIIYRHYAGVSRDLILPDI